MIFDAIFEDDLFTIRRYETNGRDSLGRPARSVASETTVDGLLRQTGTVEGEAYVADRLVATMPIGTDLRPDDEVVCRGRLYEVDGSPTTSVVPGMSTVGIVTAALTYVGPVTP